jgi:hypothetical protein
MPRMAVTPADLSIYTAIKDFGFPAVVAILLLTQLSPKIDRGIQIADHVDAELQYLAVRGCAPLSTTPPP